MIELQAKCPRDRIDSMLPRQFAGHSPERLRNPLPASALVAPALQLPGKRLVNHPFGGGPEGSMLEG